MKSYFSNQFFTDNRQTLRRVFGKSAPIVMTANGLLQRGADSTYAFNQDANFWYLTGINEPDVLLVMDAKEEYLIVPNRSNTREAFDGAIDNSWLIKQSGIKQVFNDTDGWEKLLSSLKKAQAVATVASPPAYIDSYGFYINPSKLILNNKFTDSGLEVHDIGQDLARMRMIKQPTELKAIQAAIDITTGSINDATAPETLKNYQYEYELEAAIRAGFRKRGADGDSFEPIVAGGKNACTLHNVANNSKLGHGDLFLTDVGAEVEHYAADITRTYSFKKPTQRQQDIHAAVLEVQNYAMSQLKPGVLIKEYEQKIENIIGQQLKQLKLIKNVDHDSVRKFYPHSTSHFMGLNVHDVGDYYQPLQPGIVMTVEPGIYVPTEGIGVRIEDDVLITKTGIKVLSSNLSRSLQPHLDVNY